MDRILGRYSDFIFGITRIIVGIMFMMHGTQKLFGWPGGKEPAVLATLRGAGVLIETITGLLIALGLFTGIAAFIASGTMAVAYFKFHGGDGFIPLINRGELAVVYCFLFLFIAAHGPGKLSLDAIVRKKGRKAR